ncbi:MAG: transcriptional regulator [Rhodopseudomonas sp.]|nr:transcriptional regulator [Rhodopseudomonas sp.]
MSRLKTDFVAKARTAWPGEPPAFVVVLAEEATRTSLAATAKRIGYTGGLVSNIIANKYPAGFERIEAKVRGALMNECVMCPVLGEIGRDRCLDEQAMPRLATSSIRSKLWRACRNGCPHSRIKTEGGQ